MDETLDFLIGPRQIGGAGLDALLQAGVKHADLVARRASSRV